MFRSVFGVFAAIALVAAQPAEAASRRDKATGLVENAARTTAYFAADSAFEPLWSLANDAKAMVIVPQSIRAGFIIAGSAGNAVMVAREKDGSWSQPTFLTIGSLSLGFQAGGEVSETILLVMTQRGMERLLSTTVKLGADLSVAAGPIGAGAKAQTADILAFSRSRGLYGGVSLEGAVLKTRGDWNRAYYQAEVIPTDVIFRGEVYNPASAQLQNAAWRLANRDAPPLLAPAVTPLGPQSNAPLPARTNGDPEPQTYEDDAVWGAPIRRNE